MLDAYRLSIFDLGTNFGNSAAAAVVAATAGVGAAVVGVAVTVIVLTTVTGAAVGVGDEQPAAATATSATAMSTSLPRILVMAVPFIEHVLRLRRVRARVTAQISPSDVARQMSNAAQPACCYCSASSAQLLPRSRSRG
jgi:hypothetical protein